MSGAPDPIVERRARIRRLVAIGQRAGYGAMGVATSYAVLAYIVLVPALLYAGYPLGIRTKDVLAAIGPQIFCALATAGFGFVLRGMLFEGASMLVRLIALSILCGAFYLALIVLGFRMTKPLAVAASLLRRRPAGGG